MGTSVRLSMDGGGLAYDNILNERLWRTVKYEEVFLKDYATLFDARDNLGEYLEFYNIKRRHSSLGRRTPAAVYWANRPRMNNAG